MAGLIIAAPQSGSGKTLVTLGLLRQLRRRDLRVAAAKVGPDYIDPGFLAAACGTACRNLDVWAMRRDTLATQIAALEAAGDIVLCEGVMGLFDGAGMSAAGSTAALAQMTGWPVILVIGLDGQAASVAALIEGFARHRDGVTIAGVIFNRVGSARHAAMAKAAVQRALPDMPILGALPRDPALTLPARHLGLIPAGEHCDLDTFVDRAADLIADSIDVAMLLSLARRATSAAVPSHPPVAPFGATIAIARDQAFAFAYDAILNGWREQGAALSFFSPLAGEAPSPEAAAVYLPGGYPELFAGAIARNRSFIASIHQAAQRGAVIYGECGGYMVLGESLVDADGTTHAMAGLLPLKTSFATRRLHLGYRVATIELGNPLGPRGEIFRGHEFHYATVTAEGEGTPLFRLEDPDGMPLGSAGRIRGRVMGSFVHLIDHA